MATVSKEIDDVRGRRHLIRGVVVSDKMDKTRVVDVERRVRHSFYEKVMTKHSKFYVHDEGNESHTGDMVEIMSARPLSRLKRWRLVRVIKAMPRPTPTAEMAAGTTRKEQSPRVAEAKAKAL
jgi:small subunit ribosomal protein S17